MSWQAYTSKDRLCSAHSSCVLHGEGENDHPIGVFSIPKGVKIDTVKLNSD